MSEKNILTHTEDYGKSKPIEMNQGIVMMVETRSRMKVVSKGGFDMGTMKVGFLAITLAVSLTVSSLALDMTNSRSLSLVGGMYWPSLDVVAEHTQLGSTAKLKASGAESFMVGARLNIGFKQNLSYQIEHVFYQNANVEFEEYKDFQGQTQKFTGDTLALTGAGEGDDIDTLGLIPSNYPRSMHMTTFSILYHRPLGQSILFDIGVGIGPFLMLIDNEEDAGWEDPMRMAKSSASGIHATATLGFDFFVSPQFSLGFDGRFTAGRTLRKSERNFLVGTDITGPRASGHLTYHFGTCPIAP